MAVQSKWLLQKNQKKPQQQIPWMAHCNLLGVWNKFHLTEVQKSSFSLLIKTVNNKDIISKDINFKSSVLLKMIRW